MTVMAGVTKVEDYPRLRATLDRAVRAGLCNRVEVFRAADDAAEMLLLVHVASLDRAKELLQDPRYTRAFFEQAGVEEYPPLFVGDLLDVFPTEQADEG
jgi:hypothetical protein